MIGLLPLAVEPIAEGVRVLAHRARRGGAVGKDQADDVALRRDHRHGVPQPLGSLPAAGGGLAVGQRDFLAQPGVQLPLGVVRHQATGRDAVDVVGEGVVLGHAAQHLDPLAQPHPNVVGDQLGDVLVALADLDGVLVLLVADAPLRILKHQGQEAAHQQHQHQGRQHGGDNHRPLPAAALAAGQQLQDLAGVARPFVGVQLQAAVDQPDQLAVDARHLAVARWPRRGANSLAVQLQPVRQPGGVAQRLVQGRVLARRVARHHHVQERPEAVHVPARVGDLLRQVRLLGRHEKKRAQRRRGVVGQVRLAEVRDQRPAARVQEDVARFQVAMADALGVDVGQGLGDLLKQTHTGWHRQRAAFQLLSQ